MSKRYLSINAVKSLFTSNEVTKPLGNLPKVSGNGPFHQDISFLTVGPQSNLLNVQMPSSSILNLRYHGRQHDIITVNGDISQLSTQLGKVSGMLNSKLLFQQISNPSSLSLLLASKRGNFFILENSAESSWSVLNKPSLIGWCGNLLHLQVELKKVNFLNGGKIILSHSSEMFKMKIEENESVYVNEKSLVAINPYSSIKGSMPGTSLSVGEFDGLFREKLYITTFARRVVELVKPRLDKIIKPATMEANMEGMEQGTEVKLPHPSKVKGLPASLKKVLNLFRRKPDSLVEIQGPAEVILANDFTGSSPLLSKSEEKYVTE